jgi:acyl dehydratase
MMILKILPEYPKDYNPVHFDARFAGALKFSTPICHGLLIVVITIAYIFGEAPLKNVLNSFVL